jgi:hypothetical protein
VLLRSGGSCVCHVKLRHLLPGVQHSLQLFEPNSTVTNIQSPDFAHVQFAAEAQPGSGPADTPAALLQHLALRLEKGSPMHTRIMDLKEGLFQIGEPFSMGSSPSMQ